MLLKVKPNHPYYITHNPCRLVGLLLPIVLELELI